MSDRSFEEPTSLVVRFVRTLAALDSDCSRSWRLCEAMRQIAGASGIVATIGYLSDVRTTLCATDNVALAVDSLQELVGEGPGFDAAATDEMVTCYLGDVHKSRWSQLSRAMWAELSDVTVFAIPVRARALLTGVVTLYTRQQRPLHVSVDDAALLGRAIGAALLADGREHVPCRRLSGHRNGDGAARRLRRRRPVPAPKSRLRRRVRPRRRGQPGGRARPHLHQRAGRPQLTKERLRVATALNDRSLSGVSRALWTYACS